MFADGATFRVPGWVSDVQEAIKSQATIKAKQISGWEAAFAQARSDWKRGKNTQNWGNKGDYKPRENGICSYAMHHASIRKKYGDQPNLDLLVENPFAGTAPV